MREASDIRSQNGARLHGTVGWTDDVNIFFSPAYAGAAHDFDTTRKGAWVRASFCAHPIAGTVVVAQADWSELLLAPGCTAGPTRN
jgi:hypothetical protein